MDTRLTLGTVIFLLHFLILLVSNYSEVIMPNHNGYENRNGHYNATAIKYSGSGGIVGPHIFKNLTIERGSNETKVPLLEITFGKDDNSCRTEQYKYGEWIPGASKCGLKAIYDHPLTERLVSPPNNSLPLPWPFAGCYIYTCIYVYVYIYIYIYTYIYMYIQTGVGNLSGV
jgi:hypothetical protein